LTELRGQIGEAFLAHRLESHWTNRVMHGR
jgi:hypothetical protein